MAESLHHALGSYLLNNWAEEWAVGPKPATVTIFKMSYKFRPESKIFFFVTPEGFEKPLMVCKAIRDSKFNQCLIEAHKILERLRAEIGPIMARDIPRPVALAQVAGHTVLIETAISGKSLATEFRQKEGNEPLDETKRNVSDMAGWLGRWYKNCGRHAPLESSEIENTIYTPITRFREFHKPPKNVQSALAELEEWAKVRCSRPVSIAPYHGDLSLGNIVRSEGRINVVDWESARFGCLVGLDLIFFLISYGYFLSAPGFRKRAYILGLDKFFFEEGPYRELTRSTLRTSLGQSLNDTRDLEMLILLTLLYGSLDNARVASRPDGAQNQFSDLLTYFVDNRSRLTMD